MTGNARSTLAKHSSHLHLSVRVEREACPLQLAPTASTTATLAMGDALAVALMKARNFQPQDFARFHPGGSLGRRCCTACAKRCAATTCPSSRPTPAPTTVLSAVTRGKLGIALVSDDRNNAIGIVTDGDLRRAVQTHKEHSSPCTAAD
jgi:arabinose-5-phosphate isomerase